MPSNFLRAMKKLFLFLMMVYCMAVSASSFIYPTILNFYVRPIKPIGTGKPIPRSPIQTPAVEQDGHTLYFETGHADFTLLLIEEDSDEAYEVSIPSSVDIIVLPSTLSGDYELRLFSEGSTYYFYCDVTFE